MIGAILLALTAAAQPATAARAEQIAVGKPVASTKMRCVKRLETGSLVKKTRVCHSKAEWARLAQSNQEEWGALQGTKGSTHGE